MPELPEVETVKNELSPHIIGRKLTGITLCWEGIVKKTSAKDFLSRIIGRKVTGLERYGKYLIFSLNDDDMLVTHLKMAGSLLVGHNSSEPPKYTRAIIHLDNGTNIFFSDPRKFGAMWLIQDKRAITDKLGPEPLEDSFTAKILAQRLSRHAAPIKAVLLDQKFVAGIGNMYADEALYNSKIHPLRPANSLSPDGIDRLYRAIRQVLLSGIKNKGASMVNYVRPDGTTGTAHSEFKVAHGRGKYCETCGTPIKRITVRNRGTYFCPSCQMEL